MNLRFIHTLLVIMSAIIGNAQINGFDLTLYILMPPLIILTLIHIKPINTIYLFKILFTVFLLVVLTTRAINLDIPYFEYYYLWTIKAIILCFCVALGPVPEWNNINQFIYFAFCILLFVAGDLSGGRFSSFFGPNMLYRIFGLLYIYSFLTLLLRNEKYVVNHAIFLIFGALTTLLTGSVAAILIICIPMLLVIPQLNIAKRYAYIIVLGILIVFFNANYTALYNFPVIRRALYKYESFQTSYRFEGWADIIKHGFQWNGNNYDSLSYVWRYGYSYPHNIFVELYSLYGIFGIATVLIMISTMLRYTKKSSIFYLTFITVSLGAMLSGDLSDNYGAVALGIGLSLQIKNRFSIR